MGILGWRGRPLLKQCLVQAYALFEVIQAIQ